MSNLSEIAIALNNCGFASRENGDLLDLASISLPKWELFSNSWNHLEQDHYMADGGKYRFRRYSEFRLDTKNRTLRILPHKPYQQRKEINYLNGDIERHFLPIQLDICNNEAFQSIVLNCGDILHHINVNSRWLVQIFQNRIFARRGISGKPTPEGVHRDGVDYVLTFMINRYNIVGGESSTYDTSGRVSISTLLLENLGDFILLDDNKTKHGVQPVSCINKKNDGYRDVLIVMFTQMNLREKLHKRI